MRPLSYSSMSTYEQCPLKWKLHYVDKVPELPKPYFSFGKVMHDVMEYFYMEKEGGKIKGPRFEAPSVDELLRYYADIWTSEGYADAKEEENYRSLGEKIIGEYHSTHAPSFRMPVATEHFFMLDIEGVKVRGYIDRVDRIDEDSVAILDYKTSKNPFSLPYVKGNEQLALYQMAFEELHGKRVERLSLYHLRSNMDFSVGRRPDSMIDALRSKIVRIAESIENEGFEPKKSNLCAYCDYQHLCPYFMDLFAERTEEKIDVEELVEEYARLSDELGKLKRKKDEISAVLKEYAENRGLRAIYGTKNAVTISSYDRVSFDEDVKKVLESEGIWNSVSKLDDRALKELIDSGGMSVELAKAVNRYKKAKKVIILRKRKLKDEEMDVS